MYWLIWIVWIDLPFYLYRLNRTVASHDKKTVSKLVGNNTTIDNQSRMLTNVTMIIYLENGSLTFSYNAIRDFKPDPVTGTVPIPPSVEIPLTFIYGTGDYYKANVKYSSLVTLREDVNRTRFFEIIIQK